MYRFNNDYHTGMHPAILKALEETNNEAYPGYGLDPWCDKAQRLIREAVENPLAHVHFLVGGTQTNYTVIDNALRPYESIICASSGHINVHETGAVEHTGHKCTPIRTVNGKIAAKDVEKTVLEYQNGGLTEHTTTPAMVYISFPTEYGTLYSKKELTELYSVCRKYGLYLFIDGARLGYGLGAKECDMTLADIAARCDIFYIGGTKCGAAFGEAVVILNDSLKRHFRSSIKQNGALLAKGWLLGLQFAVLFEDGLYLSETKKATAYAMEIKKAFKEKGLKSFIDSPTNQQFVILNEMQAAMLAENFIFENEGLTEDGQKIVRFCTSWASTREEIDALIEAIRQL